MQKSKLILLRGANIIGDVLQETETFVEIKIDRLENPLTNDWKKGEVVKIGNSLIADIKTL